MKERLVALEPFIAPHLKTLKGMNRPVCDWIQDNLLIKYFAGFFSIADAISALHDDWNFYGSSPHFVRDWRWYKDLHGEQRKFADEARIQYLSNIVNLVDYRFRRRGHSVETGEKILALSQEIFDVMLEIEEAGSSPFLLETISNNLKRLSQEVPEFADETKASFEEVAEFLESGKDARTFSFNHFQSFFGRGQQYVSFIRNSY